MSDKKIIEQIVADFRQHSSGESILRAQMAAKITDLQEELSAWGKQGAQDDKRIMNLKYAGAEYKRALKQISEQREDGTFKLSREECVSVAQEALKHGGEYEK